MQIAGSLLPDIMGPGFHICVSLCYLALGALTNKHVPIRNYQCELDKSKHIYKVVRSNFNSRGVNSREIGRFFGHNSEPVRS